MLLKRRLAVLVAAASIAVMMLLAMAPLAFAQGGGQSVAVPPYRGQSPFGPPPGAAPGSVFRVHGGKNDAGQVHDSREHRTGPRAQGCNSAVVGGCGF